MIASKIDWHQIDDSKRATESPPKEVILSDFWTNAPSNAPWNLENAWFSDNIVGCVHGELVIATKMGWNQFEDSKRATETAHPKQSCCLVSGQMTLEMHCVTQENVWLVDSILVHVDG